MPPIEPQLQHALLELLSPLRRFCWMLTGSYADSDDLLQGTVERLLQKGVPDKVDLKPWVFRVCKNLWIDELRARQRKSSTEVDTEVETLPDGQYAEQGLEVGLEAQQMLGYFQLLPDDQREALYLVAVEGMTYQAVSEALNIPLGTVQSRVSRGRRRLLVLGQQ